MKVCAASLLLALLFSPQSVPAESGVFKCTGTDGAIIYQGQPCASRDTQTVLVEPGKRDRVAAADPVDATSDANGDKRSVFEQSGLEIGMSDTKVLNMRGWGRPKHIARSRGERGWHEDWTYVSRADGATRIVQFLNGRVTAIGAQEPQVLAASPRIEPHSGAYARSGLALSEHALRPADSSSPGHASAWSSPGSHEGARLEARTPLPVASAQDSYGANTAMSATAATAREGTVEQDASLQSGDPTTRNGWIAWSEARASAPASGASPGGHPGASAPIVAAQPDVVSQEDSPPALERPGWE